ncbi:GNAT family N-acetyltransferase [Zavarzinella formosa]|uniref:GNAT family N-acetyltransferase n=1 Tax=Zavarzinella formosa TaxID=360055 RepID=UPI0003126E30|nr:GNAT family N-acetyltransferase [Zavarzinella formosa]
MAGNVAIRRGENQDAGTIAAFNRAMAWETEEKELDLATVTRGVGRVFEDPMKGFYLVAEADGEIVGQLMVTFEWSDWRDGWFWWIQSVYVREDHRRTGIFRQLFDSAVEQAKKAGDVVGLRLYVERDNTKAQATYQSLGMYDAGYLVEETMIIPL